MIAGLSDFPPPRFWRSRPASRCRLREEMDFTPDLSRHPKKVRFARPASSLALSFPAELYAAQVPSLILQPMVENMP